jgi:hypothetical protein
MIINLFFFIHIATMQQEIMTSASNCERKFFCVNAVRKRRNNPMELTYKQKSVLNFVENFFYLKQEISLTK